jgi:hypothetical protein
MRYAVAQTEVTGRLSMRESIKKNGHMLVMQQNVTLTDTENPRQRERINMKTIGCPTTEQIQAITKFARFHGRCWKSVLRNAWMATIKTLTIVTCFNRSATRLDLDGSSGSSRRRMEGCPWSAERMMQPRLRLF